MFSRKGSDINGRSPPELGNDEDEEGGGPQVGEKREGSEEDEATFQASTGAPWRGGF